MREIKFRVFDKLLKKWLDPDTIWMTASGKCVSRATNRVIETNASDDYFTFVQYTGLKDKNGKEIYEGDLIKMKGDTDPFSVIFTDGAFYLSHDNKSPNWRVCQDSMNRRGQEAIGNIYTNPELLEDSER